MSKQCNLLHEIAFSVWRKSPTADHVIHQEAQNVNWYGAPFVKILYLTD